MKTLLVTTPIRPKPVSFPPFGSLSLINHLRKNCVPDIEFYNIDANRPDYEDVLKHIFALKPDILAISAVVSTAYAYSKRLSLDVKAMFPDVFIILGGNMAVSANVLLRRTGVDVCVNGEGEDALLALIRHREENRDDTELAKIRGLTFLGKDGGLVNTGYASSRPAGEVWDIDWDDLEKSSDMNVFFPVLGERDMGFGQFSHDPRAYKPERRDKRMGTLHSSKGCVSRCTFCHRWDKGIRFIPVTTVMKRLDEIIERFDVGFVDLADENFGTDRRWMKEFCKEIKKRDVLWCVSSRARSMTPELNEMMRDSGCSALVYGNETGSPRMLEIMEKKVPIEDNYSAVRMTIEAGMGSNVQLVLGMPGECPETIMETIEFCKFTNSIKPEQNPNDLSINYAQALPGTPLYEFARGRGFIGEGIDGEEEYLIQISDRNAHDELSTLNFTEYPKLVCETWRPLITVEVNYHYIKKYGLAHYHEVLLRDTNYFKQGRADSGYFANPKRLMETGEAGSKIAAKTLAIPGLWSLISTRRWGLALICHPISAYRLRRLLILMVIAKDFSKYGPARTLKLLGEYFSYKMSSLWKKRDFSFEYKSLRKIVNNDIGALPDDEEPMRALRRGQ